jgi:hypothetical protein
MQATSTVSRGGLGVLAGEQEEIRHAHEQWRSTGVDPVRVGDHPGVGGLPEHLRQTMDGRGGLTGQLDEAFRGPPSPHNSLACGDVLR